jgi:pimeloyl-ACP methyl ester carboxylesterase
VGGIVRGNNTIAGADREHVGVRELALDEADLSVERLIPALGQQIRVSVRAGSGVPLVLCNGIGAGLEVLEPLIDQLDPDTTVVRFDVPGVGGASNSPMPYSFPYLAAVLGQVLRTLGFGGEGIDVLGLSWGVLSHSSSPSRTHAAVDG